MPKEQENNNMEEITEKNLAWKAQQNEMVTLNNEGAKKFFSEEKLPEINSLFTKKKEKLVCIDEGCAHIPDNTLKMSMAGSGILFPADSWEERLNRVAELCINNNIIEVTSHDGCGAAKLAWQRDGGEMVTGFKNPDEYGKKWSKELMEKINEKRKEINEIEKIGYSNINQDEMVRAPEFHSARAIWFDTTNEFNPSASKNIPKGFLIDYGLVNTESKNEEEKQYAFDELKVAINIAFGHHGFEENFTSENPFVIVVISNNEAELNSLQEKILQTIKQDEKIKIYADRIKIDGFVKK